ncbi:MAG TPA: hypothetical protein VGQ24_11180 [Gemmatimonadales bacterium]|jgi:hypothetical protein|nr:hypothetical protein [Gemmatimonadales bacterium]
MEAPFQPRRRLFPILLALVVAYLLIDLGVLAFRTYADMLDYRDARYPDSAVLLVVAHLVKTGHIYSDINLPPYLPSVYGPLYYLLLSLPYRLAVMLGTDPMVFLRITTLIFALGCLGMIVAITRRIGASPGTGLLAALLAVERMWEGGAATVSLRPDLVGLFFALLGVFLCLDEARRGVLTAGAVSVGVALLCKQTFVAAPVAIFLWLLWRRRFRAAAWWVLVTGLTVGGGYALFIWREPLSLQLISALSRPIREYRGALQIALDAGHRLTAPLFFLGLLYLWRHRDDRTVLLMLYILLAWCVALATIVQIGGAANYFYEPLMASAPLAAGVLIWLDREQRRSTVPLSVLLALLQVTFLKPRLERAAAATRGIYFYKVQGHAEKKARWERFRSVLAGRRLLARDPEIAAWSSPPVMPDPFLNRVLEMAGKWSSAPIVRAVEQGSYEAVVVPDGAMEETEGFRGLLPWNLDLVASIRRRYELVCMMDQTDVWLPRGRSELRQLLPSADCVEPGRQAAPR